MPFTVEGRTLRFFAGAPGIVRVLTGDRELVYSLTLPQPGDVLWTPTNAKRGLARPWSNRTRFARYLAMAGHRWWTGLARRLDSVRPQAQRLRRLQTPRRNGALEKSVMTFERAWVLAFLLLPLGWMLFEWRRTRRTLALALKTLAFLAIILALAEPS